MIQPGIAADRIAQKEGIRLPRSKFPNIEKSKENSQTKIAWIRINLLLIRDLTH